MRLLVIILLAVIIYLWLQPAERVLITKEILKVERPTCAPCENPKPCFVIKEPDIVQVITQDEPCRCGLQE